jgi:hypothetical protein
MAPPAALLRHVDAARAGVRAAAADAAAQPLVAWEAAFAATLIFPVIGMIADKRRTGAMHPAWSRGIAVMIGSLILTDAITYSPVGTAIYRAVTAGSPGANVGPLDFSSPPTGSLITGR